MTPDAPALDLRTIRDRPYPVVEVHGDVDLKSCAALRDHVAALLEQRPETLVVDLAGVGHVDSSGVGTFVEIKHRAERRGTRLALACMPPRVRAVFEITRLDRVFTIVDSLDEL